MQYNTLLQESGLNWWVCVLNQTFAIFYSLLKAKFSKDLSNLNYLEGPEGGKYWQCIGKCLMM
jgi:hypothetical protein